jgi:hypothetical protein
MKRQKTDFSHAFEITNEKSSLALLLDPEAILKRVQDKVQDDGY